LLVEVGIADVQHYESAFPLRNTAESAAELALSHTVEFGTNEINTVGGTDEIIFDRVSIIRIALWRLASLRMAP
jgi:hypothetical protein